MVKGTSVYANAVKSLWNGKCTVFVQSYETSKDSGREIAVEKAVYTDEPCRISYKTINVTADSAGAAQKVQSVVLFISTDVVIPPGSKITVTQNGATTEYEKSGAPAVYSHHQEIPLDLFKGWA